MNIIQALTDVSTRVGAVKKDGFNSGQRFQFRGIDHVVNAVHGAMVAVGVIVVPSIVSRETIIVDAGGKKLVQTLLTVDYVFYGPEGDSITATVASEATDYADKSTAKAMSVALRTALLQVLMLPTDEVDPDEDYHRVDGATRTVEQLKEQLKSPPAPKQQERHPSMPTEWAPNRSAVADRKVVDQMVQELTGPELTIERAREIWSDAKTMGALEFPVGEVAPNVMLREFIRGAVDSLGNSSA